MKLAAGSMPKERRVPRESSRLEITVQAHVRSCQGKKLLAGEQE